MKNKIIFKTLMLKGEAGSTIVSMEKTGHVGTADIYTITFNDGSTTEISLENMSAITSVEKTSSTDTEDIYTITCADGSTQTFSVLNHNADLAAMSDDIDTIDARVDNFINSVVPNTVETLWTGSIEEVGDSATLSKAVSNFDYIDLYLLGSADSKYIRVPATQTVVQIQQQNLSDNASSNFLRLWEMGVSISGTTVSITKSIAWEWDDPDNSNPTVTANAQNAIPITRIDGVKVASDTPAELADVRVGADGVTYGSAGAAVRGQISGLKEDLNTKYLTWEQGALSSSDGDEVTSSNRIRTADYIPTYITRVASQTGYYVMLFAWDSTDSFVGVWNPASNSFVNSLVNSTAVNINTIPNYRKYKYRLVVREENNSNIDPSSTTVVSFYPHNDIDFLNENVDALENVSKAQNINLYMQSLVWEQGSIDYTQSIFVDSTTRLRTKYPVYYNDRPFWIGARIGYTVRIFKSDDMNRTNITFVEGVGASTKRFTAEGWYDFVIVPNSSQTLDPATFDFSVIRITQPSYINHINPYKRDFIAQDTTVNDVYAYLDTLKARHTKLITKTLLFTEDSGIDGYYYTLGTGTKKALIVSGQHGPRSDPKDSVLTLCRWIKALAENELYYSEFASKLLSEYTIYVIPVLNVYGWDVYKEDNHNEDAGGRTNYNAVNLNRDWASPTQPETIATVALIQSIEPEFILDLHCTGDYPVSYTEETITNYYSGNHWFSFGSGDVNVPFQTEYAPHDLANYDMTIFGVNETSNAMLSVAGSALYGATISGLLETNFYVLRHPSFSNDQIESANFNALHNIIKYMYGVCNNSEYKFEATPNQQPMT